MVLNRLIPAALLLVLGCSVTYGGAGSAAAARQSPTDEVAAQVEPAIPAFKAVGLL